MPSLKELRDQLDAMIAKGQGEERGALFLPDVEAKSRVKNEKGRDRFIWNTGAPQFYSRLNAQKDRYQRIAVNATVATEVFISVLESVSDLEIKQLSQGEKHEPIAP